MKNIIFALLLLSQSAFSATYPFDPALNQNRIVNFWATWCGACKEELKDFEADFAGLKDISIILISVDSDAEAAKKWLEDNFKLPHLFVSDAEFKIADQLKIDSFPITFAVNRQNEIVYTQKVFKKGESTKAIVEAVKKMTSQVGQ